ncbi:MAG: flagellar biosynthetic protein FliO [Hydrogenophilaceae bacterium]|nr:flagellar biosynthetic protein FliO [Hydrogenophilaceae bacterium]
MPRLLGQLGLLPLFAAYPAIAADSAAVQTSTTGALFQTFLALVVVLGILYAFLWLLRRYAPAQTGAQGVVKVVGGVMLGPREKVVVVEVGETWLLLGVAPGQVNTLHTLAKPEGYAASPIGSPMPNFAGKLGEILTRRKN